MKSVEYNPHDLGLNIKMKRFKSGQLVVVGQGREGIAREERPRVMGVKAESEVLQTMILMMGKSLLPFK